MPLSGHADERIYTLGRHFDVQANPEQLDLATANPRQNGSEAHRTRRRRLCATAMPAARTTTAAPRVPSGSDQRAASGATARTPRMSRAARPFGTHNSPE